MKIAPFILIAVSALTLCCCGPKVPEEEKKAAFLVVNRQMDSHEWPVSPEGAESAFTVSCDAAWEMTLPEDAPWLEVGEKKSSGKQAWSVPYAAAANESLYPRQATLKFTAGEHSITVTVTQAAPDPLTLNKVPGLYGMDSGSITVLGHRQSSSFHYGGRWAYRIIDPNAMTVYVIDGIPEDPVPGSKVTLRYKKVVQGLVESLEIIEDVEVVRNLSGMVWLRKDDTRFFIVEK